MARSLLRTAAALTAVASGWLVWWCAEPRLRAVAGVARTAPPTPRWTLADVVGASVAVVAVVAYSLMFATAAVAVGSQLLVPHRAGQIALRGWAGPRWWRTAVLTACGIGVAAQAAAATPAPERPPCAGPCAPALVGLPTPDLDGLPYPDLPTGPPTRMPRPIAPGRAGPHGQVRPAQVTVRVGDCLWTIATALAPPDAGVPAIAALTARLYAANRQLVGDDPDLIYPGTVLRAPGGSR
jgi:hypothetical protein